MVLGGGAVSHERGTPLNPYHQTVNPNAGMTCGRARLTLSLTHPLPPCLSLTHSLSLYISLSLTHTLTHTLSLTHRHTLSLSLTGGGHGSVWRETPEP